MAKKVIVAKEIEEIKKALKDDKALLGTESSIKGIKTGKVTKVFLTSNCPDDVVADIEHYAKLADVEVVKLKQPNDELGTLCKKPFSISMISLLK